MTEHRVILKSKKNPTCVNRCWVQSSRVKLALRPCANSSTSITNQPTVTRCNHSVHVHGPKKQLSFDFSPHNQPATQNSHFFCEIVVNCAETEVILVRSKAVS